MENIMSFTVKDFGPDIRSLDGISPKTIEEHLKLYTGYVNKSNEIIEKLAKVDLSTANQVFSDVRELKVELSFAIGGVQNHELYFANLKANGGLPSGKLKAQIEKDFGSFENYLKDLKASGLAARGWVWTVWSPDLGRLINWIGDSQNTYLGWYLKPLFALDVYEHAYFIDTGANRGAYLDNFIKNINWDKLSKDFETLI
jgi:superoxide dismutase, Fe-Mn family